MEENDRDLMGRLARGDREALAPLMQRHYQRLYRIAHSYLRSTDEALDAVQETFVKVYQKAGQWKPVSEVGPWLTRIAVNQSIDRYRRSQRRRKVETPLDDPGPAGPARIHAEGGPPPDAGVLRRELGEKIGAALETLPERQRAIFVLRHYEEMSLHEIAAALAVPLGTVKSCLHRAVDRMRTRLGDLL
jgi:RNA polymerase sigma-70 factor (ECF subfamily)